MPGYARAGEPCVLTAQMCFGKGAPPDISKVLGWGQHKSSLPQRFHRCAHLLSASCWVWGCQSSLSL